MPQTDLNIWLKIRDEASQQLNQVGTRMQAFGQRIRQNWLGITAAITAAAFALKKAFDFAQVGAKAQQIEQSFSALATAMGINATEMRKALQGAARDTVNFSNVAGSLSALLGQGLNMEEIIGLMKVARAESRKMGTDVEETFNQISGAVTGGFLVTVKRNFGLQVELSTAMEEYAKSTGKSAEAVSKYHKAQALANNIIKAASVDMAAFNLEQTTQLEHLQSLGAQWLDFKEKAGQALLAFLQIGQIVFRSLTVGFLDLTRVASESLGWINEKLAVAADFWGDAFNNDFLKERAVDLQTNATWLDAYAEGLDEAANSEAAMVLKIQELMQATGELSQAQTEALRKSVETIQAANKASSDDTTETVQDQFKLMETMAQRTATNMQSSLSDGFFKIMKGEFNSLQEVAASFGNAMLKMIADVIAQMIVLIIFQEIAGFATGGLSKAFSSAVGVATKSQHGDNFVSQTGLRVVHRGEQIIPAHQVGNGGGGGAQEVHYHINAVDAASFQQLVMKNRESIHMIISENLRFNGSLTKQIRTV